MAAITTEKFRLHNASQFEESFTESGNNTYYLFIGKSTPFTTGTSGGSDASPPTPVDGPTDEYYAWDDMIAAKNIGTSNIQRVIARRNWANGTTYDMYKPTYSSSSTSTSGASNSLAGAAHSGWSARGIIHPHSVQPRTVSQIQVRKAGLERGFRFNT